ncbi:MAG: PhnD/SsuA/transferrin family substrate-binding protein [Deltaproteobacteria bacterium]|nr:PhnD/SsuA/transferrin family substrate-binding protein [Deltaproteobacteria bacterium]
MKFWSKFSIGGVGAAALCAVVVMMGCVFRGKTEAAEAKPAKIRMDFIIGGKHAPWFVALEKGFYAKRRLAATIEAGKGSADTVRSIAAGGADFGFADISTAIVARSRGTGVQAVGQLGYVGATILWREDSPIKTIKDLAGKSWAISPGQAQWFLMPAYCRINKIDFKSIKIQETAAPIQPAALATKKADFIIMFRGSNDEVAELAASKVGAKLHRVFMKDTGLDIYGSGLIAKEEDIKKRPDFVRAYVEGTMEGLRYTRDHQEEALQILLKHKPELNQALATVQLKNALYEVMLPPESVQSGLGYMKPDIQEKTVRITNEYFDVARKVSAKEVFSNQFIKK